MFCASRQKSTFLVSAEQTLGVRQIVRVARIIGPYRQLSPAEIAKIQLRVAKEFERLVDVEWAQMQKEERRQAKAHPRRRPAVITRADARQRVLARLGKELAIPLLTSDNRSAVVFGKLTPRDVQVTGNAFEIEKAADGSMPDEVINANGLSAMVVDPLP